MPPFLADTDVLLYCGDALAVLEQLPAGAVDCIITSPPYYGLRDYGTGTWEGGDPACDHKGRVQPTREHVNASTGTGRDVKNAEQRIPFKDTCGKCGASRQDGQYGLEPTPDEHIAVMVRVFREARRVLAEHGTLWLNYGDSHVGSRTYQVPDSKHRDVGNYMAAADGGGLPAKNLLGMPWRVALALQADGWILRSDVVWAKPNPMPESVTDRPTRSHEYVFLFAKRPRYFYDAEAIREPAVYGYSPAGDGMFAKVGDRDTQPRRVPGEAGRVVKGDGSTGRNARSVWEIPTQPMPEAHFATFPEELVRRCLLAGCPAQVCRVCGRPRERVVERDYENPGNRTTNGRRSVERGHETAGFPVRLEATSTTVGFTDCGHGTYRAGVVLDPFVGSATTALVARKHGRRAVGIDLSEPYLEIAAVRLQQLSLLAEVGA